MIEDLLNVGQITTDVETIADSFVSDVSNAVQNNIGNCAVSIHVQWDSDHLCGSSSLGFTTTFLMLLVKSCKQALTHGGLALL